MYASSLFPLGVLCSTRDHGGCTAEFLLRQKVQSLGKSSASTTSSTLNKILRNIVGASSSSGSVQGSGGVVTSRGKCSDAEISGANSEKTQQQHPQMSEESVRRLNAKRKKLARRLLKKIRAKAKKDSSQPPSTSASVASASAGTTPVVSPLAKQPATLSLQTATGYGSANFEVGVMTSIEGSSATAAAAPTIKPSPVSVGDLTNLRTNKEMTSSEPQLLLQRTSSTRSTGERKKPSTTNQQLLHLSSNDVQHQGALGDSPLPFAGMELSASGRMNPGIGQNISDDHSLEGVMWNVGSSEGEGNPEDDLSSVSSSSSHSESDSEKEPK